MIIKFATPVITTTQVNTERDRRVYSVFKYNGKYYDCDTDSLSRISGAGSLAGFAVVSGAAVGDYRWHGGDSDFAWIANDNTLVKMDAQTCFGLAQAAANNMSDHVFAANYVKAQVPIPVNYADDYWWPNV